MLLRAKEKLFIGLSRVSGFLFPAVISDIIIQNCNLSSPSNLVYNSQCCCLYEKKLWIKTQSKVKISQIRDKVNIPQKVGLQADLKNTEVYPRCQTHSTACSTEMWWSRGHIHTAKPAWGFGSLLQVTG